MIFCSTYMACPQSLPTWLDNKFITTDLEDDNKLKVDDVSFSDGPAVEAGNNYLSHLYRVPVKYRVGHEEKSTTLIIKAPIQNSFISKMTNSESYDFFGKEPKVYKELLPKMKEKINYEFGPQSFSCPLKNGLVLKDLNSDGYSMGDKFKQLDYKHCELAISTVAKFHACSVACPHDNADLIQELGKKTIVSSEKKLDTEMKQWLDSCVKNVLDIIDDIPECKPAGDMIKERSDELLPAFHTAVLPKSNGLNVLNNGDLWVNNMMFKHDSTGEVVDVKLIDYQFGRYASPVLDLLYFIRSSSNEDVRKNRVQNLFNTYLQTLNETLQELSCEERLTKDEMYKDLKSSINYTIVIICQYLPMALCDTEDNGVVNFEGIEMENLKTHEYHDKFVKMYRGKNYTSKIPNLMMQFHKWVTSIS